MGNSGGHSVMKAETKRIGAVHIYCNFNISKELVMGKRETKDSSADAGSAFELRNKESSQHSFQDSCTKLVSNLLSGY